MPQTESKSAPALHIFGRLITIAAVAESAVSLYGLSTHLGTPEGWQWLGGEALGIGILTLAIIISVHQKASQEHISNQKGRSEISAMANHSMHEERPGNRL